jgi:hypothetical protein
MPPQSSNQLQPFDGSVFGITKRGISRVNLMDALNIQPDQIAQVVCAFIAAANPIPLEVTFNDTCLAWPNAIPCLLHPWHPKLPEMSPDEGDEPDDDSDNALTPEVGQTGALEEIE